MRGGWGWAAFLIDKGSLNEIGSLAQRLIFFNRVLSPFRRRQGRSIGRRAKRVGGQPGRTTLANVRFVQCKVCAARAPLVKTTTRNPCQWAHCFEMVLIESTRIVTGGATPGLNELELVLSVGDSVPMTCT